MQTKQITLIRGLGIGYLIALSFILLNSVLCGTILKYFSAIISAFIVIAICSRIFHFKFNFKSQSNQSVKSLISSAVFLVIGQQLIGEVFYEFEDFFKLGFVQYADSFNAGLSWRSTNPIMNLIWGPITEEIVFRGLILALLLRDNSFWKANLGVSIIFSSLHYFDEDGVNSIANVVDTFLFSILVGFVFFKTRKIIFAIFIHFFSNLFTYIYSFFFMVSDIHFKTTTDFILYILLLLLVSVFLFIVGLRLWNIRYERLPGCLEVRREALSGKEVL